MSQTEVQVDTRSVLFTDVVGSTELRVRLGEDRAESARRAHDALVGDAVSTRGGFVVKGLGDGVMATFASAADAVGAAVAIQQAVELRARREPDEALSLRVGISVGDVTLESDDVFGVPVIEASRLCGAAGSGEVLAADLVRALSRGRGGVFEPMGSLELKGLPEPVAACRVVWEPIATGDGKSIPLPAALTGAPTRDYVGRKDLLDALVTAWELARSAERRTVLLAGEPGVGKTRTAAELARSAHAAGALVLYGRCEEELAVPYQPFVEALDWYIDKVARPALGRFPGELARMLPDLRARVPGVPAPVASDPRSEEHRLFEAVASWLADASRANGLVLVVDDLHWATKPTLLMLLHALGAAATTSDDARLLVVGAYRDTDIDRRHPLSGLLAELRRLPGVERHAITGLTESEVVTLVETLAGHELDDDQARFASLVRDETEGNPFFVGEVLRHLVETGVVKREANRWVTPDLERLTVPEGVRDVVGRRVSQLSADANDVLSVAAVIGRDVELEVLLALCDTGEDLVLDALDEAVRTRLLDETGPDQFRFGHALVRSTLYEELSVTRRRRLHRRVADALEQLRTDDVFALAHHCVAGGVEEYDSSRAVRYVLGAAEQAQGARALAEAEGWYRQALELLEDTDAPEPAQRISALCGAGECQRDQGNAEYRSTLLQAAREAKTHTEVGLLVRAVLANSRGMSSVVGGVDEDRVALTEAALAAVGPEPGADRARLLAHLAAEVTFTGDHDRRLGLADEAEALARSLDDRALLGWVLVRTGYAAVVDERWQRLVARGREAVELTDESGDPAQRVLARWWYSGALLTAGDIPDFERVTHEMVPIAEAGSPTLRWIADVASIRVLMLQGRLDQATQRNDECVAIGQELGEEDAPAWWGAISNLIMWTRGDATQVADANGAFADQYPNEPIWRTAHATFLAEAGRLDEAREIATRYELGPTLLRRGPWPCQSPALLSRLALHLDDRELAAQTLATYEPYRGCWSHYFVGCPGPLAWSLALCARTLGKLDQAAELLDETLTSLVAHGYEGPATPARLDLAETLIARGQPGDDARAASQLEEARAAAQRMDAPSLTQRANKLA